METLIFDEEQHKYTYNGVVIPSVTQILQTAGLSSFGNINESVLQEAGERGKLVHQYTEDYDNGVLDLDLLSSTYRGYIDSWASFIKDYNFVPQYVEVPLAHKWLKFAGTIDRVGTINKDELIILDIKSGVKTPEVAIQTAGYKILFESNFGVKIKKRLAIFLKPTGYKVEVFTKKADENIFLSALNITNWKRSN